MGEGGEARPSPHHIGNRRVLVKAAFMGMCQVGFGLHRTILGNQMMVRSAVEDDRTKSTAPYRKNGRAAKLRG